MPQQNLYDTLFMRMLYAKQLGANLDAQRAKEKQDVWSAIESGVDRRRRAEVEDETLAQDIGKASALSGKPQKYAVKDAPFRERAKYDIGYLAAQAMQQEAAKKAKAAALLEELKQAGGIVREEEKGAQAFKREQERSATSKYGADRRLEGTKYAADKAAGRVSVTEATSELASIRDMMRNQYNRLRDIERQYKVENILDTITRPEVYSKMTEEHRLEVLGIRKRLDLLEKEMIDRLNIEAPRGPVSSGH